MRAREVVFVSPRRVEVRDVDVADPREGQILIRTTWSGISGGTESLAYRGEIDPGLPLDEEIDALGGTFRFPFSYGYSCVGEVERGSGEVRPGMVAFAFHPHRTAVVADPADVVVLDGIDPRLATLFPLVETALQVSLDAGAVAEELVAVFGLGPVGMLTALLLQRAGADVLGVEPLPWRRGAGEAAGIACIAPGDAPEDVAVRSEGRGLALAVDCSGDPGVPRAALPLLAHEGTLLIASWYGRKESRLPLGAEFHRRRLTIRSTQVSSIPAALSARWTRERRRRVATSLMGSLPLKLLATHEFAFEDAPEAFRAVDEGREGLLHAALRYG